MLKRYSGVVIIAVFLLQSFPAAADGDWGREGDHRWKHDRNNHGWGGGWDDHRWGHGYVVRRLPAGYRALAWAGISYLFWEGLFYRYTPAGYVIVEPPVGAVVPVLPPGYTTVLVQRTPYYYYSNTYYAAAPGGYVVAAPPVAAPAAQTPVAASPATKTEDKEDIDTYEIHIPNDNGSYTLVILKKAEKGFIGPQGEFYPDHPTVEQLKALYGKK